MRNYKSFAINKCCIAAAPKVTWTLSNNGLLYAYVSAAKFTSTIPKVLNEASVKTLWASAKDWTVATSTTATG